MFIFGENKLNSIKKKGIVPSLNQHSRKVSLGLFFFSFSYVLTLFIYSHKSNFFIYYLNHIIMKSKASEASELFKGS